VKSETARLTVSLYTIKYALTMPYSEFQLAQLQRREDSRELFMINE